MKGLNKAAGSEGGTGKKGQRYRLDGSQRII